MDEMVVTRTLLLDADIDAVWRLVSEERELATWLGARVRFAPIAGTAAEVVDDDGTRRIGFVTEAEVGRRLGFAWWVEDAEDAVSTVSIALDEENGQTRLTVVEAPVAGGRLCAWSAASADDDRPDCGAVWEGRLLGLELRLLGGVALAAPAV